MPDWITQFGEYAKWIAGVGGALIVIWMWFAKPLKENKKELKVFTGEMKGQMMDLRDSMQTVQGTTDFLVGDRLAQAHDYWMRKRYCPAKDKERLTDMYDIYHARGLNTLTTKYAADLMALPDEPPDTRRAKSE